MKRNKLFFVALSLLVGSLFVSCKGKPGSLGALMGASGKPCDVLVVMEDEYITDGTIDDVRATLQVPVLSLPQLEPSMAVQTVATKDFDSFLQYVRNILMIEIDGKRFTKNTLKYGYDRWAAGQLVAVLNTPSVDSLRSFLDQNGRVLVNLFNRSELYNYATEYTKGYSEEADQFALKLFNHHLSVPMDITSYKEGKEFLWMSNNAMQRRRDIAVYRLPYRGQELTGQYVHSVRDSVLRENIPGASEGSYATTAPYELRTRRITIPGRTQPLIELRGLWEMTGGEMMGGPFVLHAFVDEAGKYIYFVEGFVYYPNENKRNLIQDLEASLFSFRPAEQKEFDPSFIRSMQWSSYIDLPL